MDAAVDLMNLKERMALEKSARYSPQMVMALRNAVLEAKMNVLIGQGMKIEQSRINAEMLLEAWENHELANL